MGEEGFKNGLNSSWVKPDIFNLVGPKKCFSQLKKWVGPELAKISGG